jgi:dihydroflavonol-4-reductase
MALPPLPEGAILPRGMKVELGSYLDLSDRELESALSGFDAVVFAAGVDERVEFPPPVYEKYLKYNVVPVERILDAAKRAGLKKALVLGSYFAYFAKLHPELKLGAHHPYIRSRLVQEEAAMARNDGGFEVMVLELPYIFGTQAGRKPVWTILVERLLAMKGTCFYTKGGTAMVTVRQVGQAMAGALERGRGGSCYPVGWFDMEWPQMLKIVLKHMGREGARIVTVPNLLFSLYAKAESRKYRANGIESGLDLARLAEIQAAKIFIDRSVARDELGVADDDIDAAIGRSIELSMEAIKGRRLLGMKAE